jgi:hypothetical protein
MMWFWASQSSSSGVLSLYLISTRGGVVTKILTLGPTG